VGPGLTGARRALPWNTVSFSLKDSYLSFKSLRPLLGLQFDSSAVVLHRDSTNFVGLL
jgi:hypothetical protein